MTDHAYSVREVAGRFVVVGRESVIFSATAYAHASMVARAVNLSDRCRESVLALADDHDERATILTLARRALAPYYV